MVARIRAGLLAGGRGFGLSTTALTVGIFLFTLTAVSIALIPIGVGVFTTPAVLDGVRVYANRRRSLAQEWLGTEIAVPYRSLPREQRAGVVGMVERCGLLLKDPATW